MEITQILAEEFHVKPWQSQAVVELLDDGATVPFIARYRKEKHGELDDQVIREMSERLTQLRALDQRRSEIIAQLEKQEVITEALRAAVETAGTLAQLEDIYRPYRPKRRTRAMIARERGLMPLAETMLKQEHTGDPLLIAAEFITDDVPDAQSALAGAMDILAETISDDTDTRRRLKDFYTRDCVVEVKAEDADSDETYKDHTEPMRTTPAHRILAFNRGEQEGKLKVHLRVPTEAAIHITEAGFVREGSNFTEYVRRAAEDAYTRLIAPSLENEFRGEMNERAQESAISVFAMNLKPLLMQPPVRGRTVLGLDPGIRTGCKVAVVDETGRVLDTSVIFPLPIHGKVAQAKKTIAALVNKDHVTAAAIGNGTASRETEQFFAELNQEESLGVEYAIVSEAGASVYSASKLAAQEFPDYDVSLRSAVSIARRLQDPLAELVKIDPKAIGVGQYQHDVKGAQLDHALDNVVEDCVNSVGVDLNTASVPLLTRVAGISAAVAGNIVAFREEQGAFHARAQLKKVAKLGPKAFEQCAGFLRIADGREPLDNTGVHPESYPAAKALIEKFHLSPAEAATGALKKAVSADKIAPLADELGIGQPTLRDIIDELSKPGRDPRDELPPTRLKKDIMTMDALYKGLKLTGTVRNVTDFGAFVDLGVHRDGLVHITEMAYRYIRHPSEVVKVGDVIDVWVTDVDKKKERIGLTMLDPEKPRTLPRRGPGKAAAKPAPAHDPAAETQAALERLKAKFKTR